MAGAREPAMSAEARPKLIFLVTEDWYFWSHRRPMARAASEAGFAVAVATRVAAHGERIRAEGWELHPLNWRRRRIGPWASIAAIVEIYRLYRRERPLIVHHVALKPAVLGGIAARLAGVPCIIGMIAGMGYAGAAKGLFAKLRAQAMALLLPPLLLGGKGRVIVQNVEDRDALAARRPEAASRIALIPGSGVDVSHFAPLPEKPPPPIAAAYVGRMIAIKGVATLVAAQQTLQRRGIDLRLILAGAPDAENFSAIDAATLARWQSLPGIAWLGPREDVRQIWAEAQIAVLASEGGEGLPKTLLEAAAMGRPIVATDIPGNRAVARAGINALLVPPGDAAALADALAMLTGDAALRWRFGLAGRALVEAEFADRAIIDRTAALYRDLRAGLAAR
jgi:glycosyltransferase involved in cell wall biosynthesis